MTALGYFDTAPTDVASLVFRQLIRTVKHRDPLAFNILHGYLLEHQAIHYVDELIPLVAGSVEDHGGDIALLGRHLLMNAADREVVKFAINLIGVCGGDEDHSSLLTIGAHAEFSLFAVVALGHAGGDIRATWEMAKQTKGWGRIQCVERLDSEFDDADIKEWLLREGFKTAVMTEYLAAICARRGGLLEALESDLVDRGLLDGAAEILAALARGKPGEGMSGYAQSACSTERFLAIIEQHESPSVHWLLACRDIERFARTKSDDYTAGGWTHEVLARCAQAVALIRSRPVWHNVVAKGLESDVDYEFNSAAEAAQIIGTDPWENRFRRLLSGKDQWYWLLETTDPQRVDRVLEHACSHIDLNAVASGYGDALGGGRKYMEHHKLDWILQALQRWPERGAVFIEAGFRSPVVRNRWGAARAALRWNPESRQPFLETVQALHAIEEKAELRDALARIIAGKCDL
jgi:hypothetical protein